MPTVTKQLDRKLGFLSVYSIAVGAMMGSGIFVLPGLAAVIAGPWVSLSYLLAGILVLPAVMSKAELATAMPVAGGSFVYVDRSMGPWLGTITGIGTWFALSAKTAFALVGLGAYLVLFSSLPPLPVSLAVLLVLLAVNYLGAGKVSGLQIAVVAVTLAALITFSFLAVPHMVPEHFTPALPTGISGIVSGAGFVFVSYNGVTKICSVAEEVKRPERNIPLGMMAAQATVMVLYALIAWICVGTIPPADMAAQLTPVAAAAEAALGSTGRTVMSVIAIVGLISMCNAGIMATSRFPFAMGRARVFPTVFEKVDKRFGTPHLSLLATGVLLVALVTLLPVQKLAKLASGFTIFVFCIVNLAVVVLRESGPRWYAPTFRSPFYPWTQVAGFVGGVALLAGLGNLAVVAVLGGFALGSVWYFAYARARIDRRSALQHLVGEVQSVRSTELLEIAEVRREGQRRVLVPVFGAEPAAERLVRLGSAFAEDGLLEVIRYEEVSEQTPLVHRLVEDLEGEQLAAESEIVGKEQHIGVEFHDILTHNAKEAAHHHALATGAQWLVLEMPPPQGLRRLVRYPMAWWEGHAPCDQAVFVDRMGSFDGDTSDDFPRIIVLAQPGPHDSLLMHVADRLAATQQSCAITLLGILLPTDSAAQEDELRRYHEQLGALTARPLRSHIIRAESTIAGASAGCLDQDLLVLSSAEQPTWRTVFRGTEAHRIADAVPCSVLTVRAPRHHVHARIPEGRLLVDPGLLKDCAADCQFAAADQNELFGRIALGISAHTRTPSAALVETLWARERRQSTALPSGVAVSGAVVSGLGAVVISVTSTLRSIAFGEAGRVPSIHVDIALVVVASPAQRATQLGLLALMARIAGDDVAVQALRAATTNVELRTELANQARRLQPTPTG